MKHICFIDTEVRVEDRKACDFGAVDEREGTLHTGAAHQFQQFIADAAYLCGHNIIDHDADYFEAPQHACFIDTLYLSPLLFPNKPYHRLLKDDKLQTDERNNPLNDAIKARELFYDEVNAFAELDDAMKRIYFSLLNGSPYFSGFFSYLDYEEECDPEKEIRQKFEGDICDNAPLSNIIAGSPFELAYCLALISATKAHSLIPRWVLIRYPSVDTVLRALRNTSCRACAYCRSRLDPVRCLEKYFNYPGFRSYNGEPLQEQAVEAATEHRSLLAIFPTGGGKSLAFQIPALMAGETERALTVVISPLQSLMKDQVDNLARVGIAEAVTINGLLDPIERAEAIERVESGIASILYISPESLRSVTIERLFLSRHIDRFVIDEAHCFSAWGQDFRVDYLYIGDFIRNLQEKKGSGSKIPVSCFTATAKQKVISDIKEYFKNKLDIELALFATSASRTNLRYEVLYKETDAEKYEALRTLIEQRNCPTIVYASRTKRTRELAEKLSQDGFEARAFNGKMDSSEKQKNQEAFIRDEVQVMVATSAFGMGVDKSNVGLVIHYDISDSLENYVQEAGRAGRNESLQAECFVLFNDGDLDKHFILLNQTKLSISEIQQVWRAIKDLTRNRPEVCCSPLEVARQAGWDEGVADIETRVKTAIQALENAGYIRRGQNLPRVYATSILVKSMIEASERIERSVRFDTQEARTTARRIIQSLISSKYVAQAGNSDAESRVDYLADRLGVEKAGIIHSIQQMRLEGLLADTKDLTAYIPKNDTVNKAKKILHRFQELENFLLGYLDADIYSMNYKELNDAAQSHHIKKSSVNAIKTLFYYWTIRGYVRKEQDLSTGRVVIVPQIDGKQIRMTRQKSHMVSEFIVDHLFRISSCETVDKEEVLVNFSVMELLEACHKQTIVAITEQDIEEALLFLSKIGAMKLEGGFLVLYSGMRIRRLVLDNKIRYKREDYKQLNEFYQQKMQQIHIVGEFANMMTRDYQQALLFVNDYFRMDYRKFLSKYFSGERAAEIERNITPAKYRQLFDSLSERQREIIRDNSSRNIAVLAGPGSGKTRVLVHKLASLLLLEDVKHEQLLMMTFSRAAAIEFKQRLKELIGNAANFVEIKTFHSYSFDLLGKIGSIRESDTIVKEAGDLIRSGDVDMGRITKTVLVIDEAQDMRRDEYALVEALMERNEEMRVIAVGDDDQNIYRFRGSDSKYFSLLLRDHHARAYSLVENFRSCKSVVEFSNQFAKGITHRMKNENIVAASDSVGEMILIKHTGTHAQMALSDEIRSMRGNGSTCILTNTNHEALLLLGVFEKQNIPAKLVQSMDGFDIYNIVELRYFLKMLKDKSTSPIISDRQWSYAKKALQDRYGRSVCLPLIERILRVFEESCARKYCTDIEMFLHESKIEDFYSDEKGVISISTIHKSKGREFDNVYMLLGDVRWSADEEQRNEEMRKLYVGMTRARKRLHIHYSGEVFDRFKNYASDFRIDRRSYARPSEIILQLSHRDVFLDFFKDKKSLILSLRSGMHLKVDGQRLYIKANGRLRPVLQISEACHKKVQQYAAAGYRPYDAVIRFICAWKGREDTAESAIILADIRFCEQSVQ